ncbi:MAG: rane protein [Myxococcales bacterium]|nr:rane protein [Myxococcales bacterium]
MRRLLFVALAGLVGMAHGEPPLRTPVTLSQALAAAAKAPATFGYGYDIEAAEANAAAARAWPNPSVHLGTNRLTALVIAGVSIPLPVFGTVGAARRVALAEANVVRAEAGVQLRQLRHRIVIAWVELARADGAVIAQQAAAKQAAELEVIARGRQSAGVGADVDVTVAVATRARADVAVAAALRNEDAASAELAGLLGWDPMRPMRAEGEPVTGDVADLDALRGRLVTHPDREAAERRVIAADAIIDQTLVERWPGLAVEGEILYDDRSFTGTAWDRTDTHFGIVLDLPVFARIGDRTRAARARAAAEQARFRVTEIELGSGLLATYRRWQAASERLESLVRDVLPATERAAALSAQAYREGARDLSSALVAERDLAALRAEINDARANAAVAFADLQLAVGEDVGAPHAK